MLDFRKFPKRSLVLGFHSKEPSDEFLALVERVRPFGIILFARNFASPNDIPGIVEKFISIYKDIEILIDQEGGEKCRILGEPYCPPMPWNLRVEKSSVVYRYFKDSAEALARLGITINLAPVADIGIGKYIRTRTFGKDPNRVAELVVAAVEGILDGGLKPCVKHFPGLGSAELDPHKHLVQSDEPLENFEKIHWIPFRSAIDAGVPYIMTTHILAPSLDSENYATYSSKIVSKLRLLGFDGKILTDDLAQMKGAKLFPPEIRIEKALDSGHNIALWCKV